MIIEESDFRIESCGDTNYMFDLELLKTVKPKGGDPRQEMKVVAYGIPFERCLQHIINNRIEAKKDTMNLSEYIKEYKEASEKVKNILK